MCDLRPQSIVDRKKFDDFYDIINKISDLLGNKEEINKRIVHSVLWVINQLNIQREYAKGAELDALNNELDTLLYILLNSGLFRK